MILLADEINQHTPDVNPDYLDWVEQTRLKIDTGIQAAEQGDTLSADDVISQLRNKVEAARAIE